MAQMVKHLTAVRETTALYTHIYTYLAYVDGGCPLYTYVYTYCTYVDGGLPGVPLPARRLR